jgi:hypothetical protein
MGQVVVGFDWDGANWPKCGKHGVSQTEVEQAIVDARFVVDDTGLGEKRLRAIGRVPSGRMVFVAFTFRERDGRVFIRPISARYMHAREVEAYEKAMADPEKRR